MPTHSLAEEQIPTGEAQYIESLRKRLLRKIADDAGDGRMHRDVHVKMHCLVKAEFWPATHGTHGVHGALGAHAAI